MAESLANMLGLIPQGQIPAASPEFLQSGQNPNIRNYGPGQQPQFVHPMLQALYNAPGAAMQGLGNGIGSLANFIGQQVVRPEMAIRDDVADNFITRAQKRTKDAIDSNS